MNYWATLQSKLVHPPTVSLFVFTVDLLIASGDNLFTNTVVFISNSGIAGLERIVYRGIICYYPW